MILFAYAFPGVSLGTRFRLVVFAVVFLGVVFTSGAMLTSYHESLSGPCESTAILGGGHAFVFTEHFTEIRGVVDADASRDFDHLQFGAAQQVFRFIDAHPSEVFAIRHAEASL